ncbi:N-acetylneuraminate synthase family protein, partial [Rickettsiales bacterium]|nr:N-acetylneuraminate synthase family protein [Rickettsiales bacterium]
MNSFRIKSKIIGSGHPVFIIAEIGINHMGNYELARKMVIEAFKSGADAVKFQIINPEESYQEGTNSYKVFSKFKLKNFEYEKLFREFKKDSIVFATPGDLSSLRFCDKIGMEAYKISSGLITNLPLIQEIAKKKKPIFVSRGMSDDKIIKKSLKILNEHDVKKKVLLHCVSIYPADYEELNLRNIIGLKKKFNINIGYSDHTSGILSVCASVALGACVIEKHFTLDRKSNPPDKLVSLEPKEFKNMVKKIREIEIMLGKEKIVVRKKELEQLEKMKRFCVAKHIIKKNDKITIQNISFKRLNKKKEAIDAFNFDKIERKVCNKEIAKDEIITLKHLN